MAGDGDGCDGDGWQVMAGDRRRWMAGAGAGWQGMAGEGRRYGRRWMQVMAGDGWQVMAGDEWQAMNGR